MDIRIVREAGGLGDVIRVLPTLRAIRARYPQADIWIYAPEAYRDVYSHSGVSHRLVPTPQGKGRRPRLAPLDSRIWKYLQEPPNVGFDKSFDLYCPAFAYEAAMGYGVVKNRIQLFAEAAGVWPCEPVPHWNVRPVEMDTVLRNLRYSGIKGRKPLVALQPFSTDLGRDWPERNWLKLQGDLQARGCSVVVLDGCFGRTKSFDCVKILRKPWWYVASLLSVCDLLVGPDSGLYHLAASVSTRALGIFASQSGKVMSQFYPLGEYVEPERDIEGPPGCRWPCFWNRLEGCRPRAGSCKVMEKISVERVMERVVDILDRA